jgi:dTDP-4-amino-4,6-dideoxygalactose transaminase
MGLRMGGRKGQCPISEKMSDQLVRLPFYNTLSENEQLRVIEAVKSFRLQSSKPFTLAFPAAA